MKKISSNCMRVLFCLRGVLKLTLVVLLVLAAMRTTAQATAYMVDTLADTSGAANCSLRDALNAANGTPTSGSTCTTAGTGSDSINFSVSGAITLTSPLPSITDSNLTISGSTKPPGITLDGGGGFLVMQVAMSATVNLDNLRVADGAGDSGGGIENFGTLSVTDITFSGNSADSDGGGIANQGMLTVTDSFFLGNSASELGGGAIHNQGYATVTDTTFAGNTGSSGLGGGILTDNGGIVANGGLSVTDSSFSGNSASLGGGLGALNLNQSGVPLIVTNSTFSGNSADAGGGAASFESTLTVTNSTFSGNSAGSGAGIAVGGGGILNIEESTLVLTNSTFAANSAGTGAGDISNVSVSGIPAPANVKGSILASKASGGNCFGSITDAGYNISNDTSCGFAKTGSAHNGDGVNPLLSPFGLASNGGPTQTIALESSSPAIDAIPFASCTDQATPTPNQLTADQRGFSRPDSLDDGPTGPCDIGAYEFHSLFLVPSLLVPGSLFFPPRERRMIVEVENEGPGLLQFSGVQVSGVGFAIKSNSCKRSLAAGKSCKFAVIFSASTAGFYGGKVTITDNGVGSPQTVSLSAYSSRRNERDSDADDPGE